MGARIPEYFPGSSASLEYYEGYDDGIAGLYLGIEGNMEPGDYALAKVRFIKERFGTATARLKFLLGLE